MEDRIARKSILAADAKRRAARRAHEARIENEIVHGFRAEDVDVRKIDGGAGDEREARRVGRGSAERWRVDLDVEILNQGHGRPRDVIEPAWARLESEGDLAGRPVRLW